MPVRAHANIVSAGGHQIPLRFRCRTPPGTTARQFNANSRYSQARRRGPGRLTPPSGAGPPRLRRRHPSELRLGRSKVRRRQPGGHLRRPGRASRTTGVRAPPRSPRPARRGEVSARTAEKARKAQMAPRDPKGVSTACVQTGGHTGTDAGDPAAIPGELTTQPAQRRRPRPRR